MNPADVCAFFYETDNATLRLLGQEISRIISERGGQGDYYAQRLAEPWLLDKAARVRTETDRSEDAGLPWQTQVFAAIAEFDSAKAPSQRMAAIRKLQPLFAGSGEQQKVLRKCLALMRRAERLETFW